MFQPSLQILDRYANVLINFALNSGRGVKKGEVVFIQVPESAKPMLISLYRSVLTSGAHPIVQYLPDNISRSFFELATKEQINFFPSTYLRARVGQVDHFVSIIAETDKHELEGIDPRRLMERNIAFKPYFDWRTAKENRGKLTWTLGMYATPAMAKEAHLSLRQCWQQIIKACYLNHQNPIKKWRQTQKEINRLKSRLNILEIDQLHIESLATDLWIGLDKNRTWLGGDGRNIPSFEVFISPDYRRTRGFAYFNQPLYRDGNLVSGIKLEFKNGKVVTHSALQGQKVLSEMIKVAGANQVGEFSLTDKRFSQISTFMAETLYDENFGGRYGNFHIALGAAYKESYPGKLAKITSHLWHQMGYNDSVIHTDIISTHNRIVTAHLADGSSRIIYRRGQFTI